MNPKWSFLLRLRQPAPNADMRGTRKWLRKITFSAPTRLDKQFGTAGAFKGHCESERSCMSGKPTAIVTGASGGIGRGLVERFLEVGYNVVATSRDPNQKLTASRGLVLLEGDIGKQQTAADAVEAAIGNFGSVDVLVNNAGIFLNKPFTDFTVEDSMPWSPRICSDSCT